MSPASPMRPRKTVLPTSFYLVASIALFVFLMIFFIDLVTVIADMVDVPLQWSDFGIFPQPIFTERMLVAVLLVMVTIMFFWSMDLIFTSRKK